MSDTMELLNAESQRTDTEYSWDMRWDSRYAGCSQYPSGPKMPLWIAILDAKDAMDSLMEEEDYDEDYSGTPEISINRFIDGKYDEIPSTKAPKPCLINVLEILLRRPRSLMIDTYIHPFVSFKFHSSRKLKINVLYTYNT